MSSKKYIVYGGIYENFLFQEPTYKEQYGPFETYEQAYSIWKTKVWLNVDNALHRLTIVGLVKDKQKLLTN